jgi:hypothetical protein
MTEVSKNGGLRFFGNWILMIGIYLACLREAASAKAGIWNLVYPVRYVLSNNIGKLFIYYLAG